MAYSPGIMSDDSRILEGLKEMRAQVAAGAAPRERLAAYLGKVERHAYKVTDEEVAALLGDGCTEDEIYQATMYRAMSAGIDRFEIGVRALRGAK